MENVQILVRSDYNQLPSIMARKNAQTITQRRTKTGANPTPPPPPFTTAPPSLAPFLENLDPAHVYITHIDTFPASFKKRIFTVPVILNLSIALLLSWRLYHAIPSYLALSATVIGYATPATVDTTRYTTNALLWIVAKRTLTMLFDFLLAKFIAPWPVTFFLEQPANPTLWRRRIGFRDAEIVVRESRNWGAEDLVQGSASKRGEESPFFKTRVLPAIDRHFVREKTGYLMMDRSWDLDFYAMVVATELVDAGTVEMREFGKSVFVHDEGSGGWLCWQVWKLDVENGGVVGEEENRKKIVVLKDRLTALGKEGLFFRWIEIVQYESGKEGEFTPKRQRETLEKVKEAFEEQGVDFEELIKDVGGLEGTPGMETAS